MSQMEYAAIVNVQNQLDTFPLSLVTLRQYTVLTSQFDELIKKHSKLMRTQVDPTKRDHIKSRLATLGSSSNHYHSLIRKLEEEVETGRRELLTTKTNLEASNRDHSTILVEDQQNHRLDNVAERVEDYINLGRNALNDLYEQRSIMKSSQKKLLNAANQLGLSRSVIRFIEQRSQGDKYILYGGMLFCVIIMYLVVHYL